MHLYIYTYSSYGLSIFTICKGVCTCMYVDTMSITMKLTVYTYLCVYAHSWFLLLIVIFSVSLYIYIHTWTHTHLYIQILHRYISHTQLIPITCSLLSRKVVVSSDLANPDHCSQRK
jgi:hypothetical protein